jgi:hypothetical protein
VPAALCLQHCITFHHDLPEDTHALTHTPHACTHALQRTCLCAACPWLLQLRRTIALTLSHTRCMGVFMNTVHDGSKNLSSLLCVGSCLLGRPRAHGKRALRQAQAHTAACVCVPHGGTRSVAARPHPLPHTLCRTYTTTYTHGHCRLHTL